MGADRVTVLTEPALEALRTIYENGSDADRERARVLLAERGLIPDPMGERRARIRAGGPMLLGELLMPDTVYGARSPLHDFLNDWHLREAAAKPGARTGCAAPRGHGKSTAAVELGALWHAANCTRRFQVIISDTYEQARGRLQAIKNAVETNDELRETYPRLRPSFGSLEVGTWREADLVFACGCRIVGFGAGTAIRGLKHREARPDLVYLDDLEDEDSVSTAYQIEKRLKWLTRTALALGSPIRGLSVLWVGTILSRDALLNLVTGAALDEGQTRPAWAQMWSPSVYRAEVEGSERIATTATVEDPITKAPYTVTYDVGEPMWSELTREDLAKIHGGIGDAGYAAEYMADPVDGKGGMLVAPQLATWVNPQYPPRDRLIRWQRTAGPGRTAAQGVAAVANMTIAVALDPQFSEVTGSNDPDLAAIVAVGQLGAESFILDAWIGRDKVGQAGRLVTMALKWGAFAAGVEVNAAQVLVADEAAQLAAVPIIREQSTEGKEVRALSLSVRLTQGRVHLLASEGDAADLPKYLTAFPNGRYKDPVDATVMAQNIAARATPVQAGAVSAPGTGGPRSA